MVPVLLAASRNATQGDIRDQSVGGVSLGESHDNWMMASGIIIMILGSEACSILSGDARSLIDSQIALRCEMRSAPPHS